MNLIQTFVGIVFSVSFFILLALVAWYIALPLLAIAFLFFVGRALYVRYLVYKTFQGQMPPRQRPRTAPKKDTPENVIDVEYTEL